VPCCPKNLHYGDVSLRSGRCGGPTGRNSRPPAVARDNHAFTALHAGEHLSPFVAELAHSYSRHHVHFPRIFADRRTARPGSDSRAREDSPSRNPIATAVLAIDRVAVFSGGPVPPQGCD
jgi:hypothetical protein